MIETDPSTKIPARWLVSNSSNAARFSAVCYLSAKHISEMYWGDAPIGLIWASWGGTRVEAWAPPSTKALCPEPASAPAALAAAARARPAAALGDAGIDPQTYSVLYNGMIHPLTKCAPVAGGVPCIGAFSWLYLPSSSTNPPPLPSYKWHPPPL